MKFEWFHLMPYPDLPVDFAERYRSVWIDIPSELFDPQVGNRAYHEYLDELEYADQLGFDGICVNEHHQNGYGLMPSPNVMAATLTRRTERAKVVIMGNSVALYNPPVRVAEEMAMLDVLSGGRLIAGFPVGTPQDTVYAYGQTGADLRRKYREGVDLILRAWREPEPFAFNGEFTKLRYVNIWPRPVQRPRPPVWIPGGGSSVETWEWCIENDFLYAYLAYYGYVSGKRGMDGYWETVERLGAERNPYRAGFLQFIAVGESDADVERRYREPAEYFYNTCLHWYPGWLNAPGYMSPDSLRRGFTSQATRDQERRQATEGVAWRDIVDRGYIIAGTPDTVVDRLRDLADTLRVGHLMVGLHFGNMRRETVYENSALFASEVMPRLRDHWAGWEDRWWPADPLPNAARPAPPPDALEATRAAR